MEAPHCRKLHRPTGIVSDVALLINFPPSFANLTYSTVCGESTIIGSSSVPARHRSRRALVRRSARRRAPLKLLLNPKVPFLNPFPPVSAFLGNHLDANESRYYIVPSYMSVPCS